MDNDLNHQINLINYMCSDINVLSEVSDSIKEVYFHDTLRSSVRLLLGYYVASGKLPAIDIFSPPDNISFCKLEIDSNYAIHQINDFARKQAYNYAMHQSINCLEKDDFTSIHRLLEEAQNVGLHESDFSMIYGDKIGTIQPPTYLIDNWLVKDTVTAIYGAPGSYKSFFVLDAALKLALGINGIQTPTCYIAAEGASGLSLRAEAWCQYHNKQLTERDFVVITQPVMLTNDASVTSFINQVKRTEKRLDIDYGLIVVDTLSQCTAGGDENATRDMSLATSNMIRIKRELNTTIVFVHHSGKDESREMRGSSAIKANTDAMIKITSKGPFVGELEVERQKDASHGSLIPFHMELVEINRLMNCQLGSSLVCVLGTPKSNLLGKQKKEGLYRQIAKIIGLNREMSLHKINLSLKRQNNKSCRDELAELLPMDTEKVIDLDNDKQVVLTRSYHQSSLYGNISCTSLKE